MSEVPLYSRKRTHSSPPPLYAFELPSPHSRQYRNFLHPTARRIASPETSAVEWKQDSKHPRELERPRSHSAGYPPGLRTATHKTGKFDGGVPSHTCTADSWLSLELVGHITGTPHLQENAPPRDPTVGLCLGSCFVFRRFCGRAGCDWGYRGTSPVRKRPPP